MDNIITIAQPKEAHEAVENDSIKLAKLIDGMFYCEGGGYDSDDVREGIQKAFEIGVQSASKTEVIVAGLRATANELENLRDHIQEYIGPDDARDDIRRICWNRARDLRAEADRLTSQAEKQLAELQRKHDG